MHCLLAYSECEGSSALAPASGPSALGAVRGVAPAFCEVPGGAHALGEVPGGAPAFCEELTLSVKIPA